MPGSISFINATGAKSSGGFSFTHPQDVVTDRHLSPAEKRAILASWISDMRSVENKPTLRQWDNGAVASVDEIRHALSELDNAERGGAAGSARRLRGLFSWRPLFGNDDDDDPPPSPVALRLLLVQAEAA